MSTLRNGVSGWLRTGFVFVAAALSGIQGAAAATGGAGAPLPYVELQAENAATNGTVLPVTYTYNTLGGEASGRRAVTLNTAGQFVEFTLPSAANSIVVRYSIPDSGTGSVYTVPLAVFTGASPGAPANVAQPNLTLTNAYSHYYGPYPFTNTPGSNHHHFYDEISAKLPNLAAGTLVRLQMLSGAASSVTIDFADFEQVAAAATAPANSLTVTADTTGQNDAAQAIRDAISQAAGRIVFIPAGTYRVDSRIIVNNVTIRGAGMWHTVLNFTATGDNTGFHGNNQPNPSSNVHISNLRMNGNIQERNDGLQTNAFGQGFTNSDFTNVWTEHFKVGAWLFGPATNVVFTGVRFRDTNADGINFNGGFTNSLVTQSHFRNNGDDGLAMWSLQVDQNNTFSFNTVEMTLLANGIAIYGGANNSITDNRVIDTGLNQGGGIHVANRFGAPALSGTTTVARNTLIRTGNLDTNWQFGTGSIWFDARDGAMNGTINVTNLLIQQAPYAAIMFVNQNITNVNFNDVTVQGAGTHVLQIETSGSASFQNVTASNVGSTGVYNCLPPGQFNIINNGGNGSWISNVVCTTPHPTPVFPPPVGGLTASPSSLDFGSQAVNTSSAARAVTVSNTGSSAAPISSIVASGDFSQTNNCGTSVAANGSCTVNVVFTPTTGGTRNGSVTINSSAGNSVIALTGTGSTPGAVLSPTPTSLSFGGTVGVPTASQAVQLTNTGTLAASIASISTSGDFSQTNNCGASLAVNASCTVNVTFTATVEGNRTGSLTVSSNATNSPTTVSLAGTAIGPNTNLALNRPTVASSTTGGFPSSNAVDGNVATYWESVNGQFPAAQTLSVDLGAVFSIGRVVLKLPPAWGTRQQTLSILGSTDANCANTASFPITIDPPAARTFVGGTNVVTIIPQTVQQARCIRVSITANNVQPGGQIAELEVYVPSGPALANLVASPSPLAFGNQNTGTSAQRIVTITNNGAASGTVTGVSISGTGQFTQTNNCGALAVNASCTVTVTFAPTTATSQSGTLTVNSSNSANPSLGVPLTGTGVSQTATLAASPSPLDFGNQTTNTSVARFLTITNTGGASANVTGVTITGPFTQTNNCGTLAAAATCTVTVTFTPPANGPQSGTVTVNSNASNPSLAVSLTGTGVAPGQATLSASPSPLAFGDQVINTSASRTVTITNNGSGAGTVSGVTISGPFTQTNNCGALAVGASCTVTVTFSSANPLGAKSGTLTVSSNATNPSLAVSLSGNAIDTPVVGCTGATNVAVGKIPVASGTTNAFVATNSNDGNLTTYWEGGPIPGVTLTVPLGTNYRICQVTIRLNPDPIWGERFQTYSIDGRDQAGGNFNSLLPSTRQRFTPGTTGTGNNNTATVDIPTTAPLASDVRLTFTENTGAPGGQVAEIIIMAVPGPNPDLTISNLSFSPSSPTEVTPITVAALVNNIGTSATSIATTAKFFCGSTQVGPTATVPVIQPGTSTPVNASIGMQPSGTCVLTAHVDDPSVVIEQNENNNTTPPINMVVAPIQSADLVPSTAWSPSSPSGGQTVTFSTTITNQGNQASSASPHTITVQIRDQAGALVSTLSPASQPSGVINANGGSVTVTAGTWVAVNGRYTVTTTVAADQSAEDPVKQANNTTTATLVVGLGANMPYDMYEAEDGTPGSGAVVVGPNRTIGDIAGEASGRRAVRLPSNGSFVQWTTRASTNTAVVRFSIPDGSTATLGVFNGATQVGTLNLVSKYAWLYGTENIPQNSGTNPRHIYDEASVRLNATVPAGVTLQVRNTSSTVVALDFLSLELATATANPNPATFVTVSGTDQQAIQNAINTANQNASMVGIFLPTGDYQMTSKINVSSKSLQIVGAGPWFTRIYAPQASENIDIGFAFTGANANGSQLRNLALFGNFTNRQDGNGQMVQFFNVANITMDNVWIEHSVPAIWTANVDNSTFTNLRLRNLFADGINLNNDSQNNVVRNSESRASGDDSFAMFNAQDVHAGINSGNLFENLTSLLTWRAAGVAIYGGGGNIIRNIYIADPLVYPGVTIASINFDIQSFIGFSGITTFDNISIVRGGGHFWGNQVFPALWFNSGEGVFTGIRINNLDIKDPTYMGVMFQTKYKNGQPTSPIQDSIFTNTTIDGANDPRGDGSNVDSTFTFPLNGRAGNAVYCNPLPEPGQGPALGAVTFNTLTMTNDTRGVVNPCPNFTITVNNPTQGTLSANPTSIAFADQATNTTSATRTITITNSGAAAVAISGVTISGEFQQTTGCGGTLAVNATCAINVSFRPTTTGAKSGAVTVNSNASNPALVIPLSGNGISLTATLSASPSPVAFGNQTTNTTSTRAVTITNTGSASGTVSGVSISGTGQFTQTNNCATLAANASCTVTVTFAPTTATSQTGTLTVSSNASNPSLTVSLTGTGVPPGTATLSASPSPVAFGDQVINTSPTRSVTITNTGTASGTISGVSINGPFTQTNNCGALAANATCTVTVTFNSANPLGAKSGTLTVSSNASNPSLTVSLTGNSIDQPVLNCANATNVAVGKVPVASATTGGFVATLSNDGNRGGTSYWEGPFSNVTLTFPLGTNFRICSVTIQLNPDPIWQARKQTYSIEGRDQSGGAFFTLVGSAQRQFTPGAAPGGNDNSVQVDVPTNLPLAADVRLTFTANDGAPGGQAAEVIIMGVPGPNPDLTASAVSISPTSPNEVTPITVSATVSNIGTSASPATNVKAYCGTTQVGPAGTVNPINAGASTPVSFSIGTLPQGPCSPLSIRVDDPSVIAEQSETNNSATGPTFTVQQAPGPDLEVLSIASSPANPAVGAAVTFTVTLNNRGTTTVNAGTTTRVTVGSTTLNNTNSPQIPINTPTPVTISGTWTATTGGATVTGIADATNIVNETNEGNNSLSRSIVVGRGAAVPYIEYEAEAGTNNGTLETANATRTFGHTNFGTESSGRQSVRLSSTGQFVEITSTAPANSIVVRNSIPDAPGGGGITATISLYVTPPGGALTFVQKLTLSSRNSWLYGTTDDTEGLSNSPGPDARRLFDESNALLSTSYPAGTKFRLQRDSGDSAAFYIIDLIDLEQVAPPLSQPAGCVSITSSPYNATPDDNTDDTAAIQQAVMDDQNGVIPCVWIPQGRFRQEQKILTPDPTRGQFNQLGIRNVVIRGAGMWYSVLFTNTEPQNVVGNINHPHEGNVGFEIENNVQISDLAIFGMTTNRANRGHGLNGRFGQNTVISNVWIEHVNVGAWVGRDFSDTPAYWNPAIGLQFSGMRIRDTYADGINFSNGTRQSQVFNSSFRNTGDDSLAVWANPFVQNTTTDVGRDNVFLNNTVQLPWRANGIAIYGGANNRIENNLVFDTMTFPGIMLATDHAPLPFSGTTTVANNGLFRCGGIFFGEAQKYGAITIFPSGNPIPGVVIRDTDIFDSTYDGIQFKTGGGDVPGAQITNVRIDDSNNGGAGILAMGGARGSAALTNVTITNSSSANVGLNPGSQFVFSGTVNGAPVQPVTVQ